MEWEQTDTEVFEITEGRYYLLVDKWAPSEWLWSVCIDNRLYKSGVSITKRAAKCMAKKVMRWHRSGYYK